MSDRAAQAAVRSMLRLGYTWEGGEYWKPPIGIRPDAILTEKPAREIAATVILRTQDMRLFPEHISPPTQRSTEALRAAVIAALPQLTQVLALMDEPTARLLFAAHDLMHTPRRDRGAQA